MPQETFLLMHMRPCHHALFPRLQALASAQTAIKKFEAAGVPWMRPLDYYAEMVKSDEHMNKVKETLMHEQQAIELAEER